MKTKIKTDTYLNKQKRYEIPFVNGQVHGIATGWYSSGQKWREIPHINGQLHGLETLWHSDGSLSTVQKWNQDQKVWEISFSSKGEIPEDAEVELFFHETSEFK